MRACLLAVPPINVRILLARLDLLAPDDLTRQIVRDLRAHGPRHLALVRAR